MIEVTSDLINFAAFLDQSWICVKGFLRDSDSNIEDWLQANWEILVETKICGPLQFLQLYGDGADCYGEFSRVTYYDKMPTHKIIGELIKISAKVDLYTNETLNSLKDYTFHSFLNFDMQYEQYNNPFNYAQFEHKILDKKILINKEDAKYYIVEI